MKFLKYIFVSIFLIVATACATYEAQYTDEGHHEIKFPGKDIIHSFYLIGDGGNSPVGTSSEAINSFKEELSKASKK